MLLRQPDFVVHLYIEDGRFVIRDLGGERLMSWTAPVPIEKRNHEAYHVQEYVAQRLRRVQPRAAVQGLHIVLPDGRLLSPHLPFSKLWREAHGAEPSVHDAEPSAITVVTKCLAWHVCLLCRGGPGVWGGGLFRG